jgi:hypothetical protein
MKKHIKVRLTADLSRYAPGLVAGVEGYTIGEYGLWSRGSDRFIGVCFPGIATLDVLWKSVEIIDEAYLEEVAFLRKKQMIELKSARNVIMHVGPRGGFRYLSYEYTSMDGAQCSVSNGNKTESEHLIEVLKQYGVEVEVRNER